MPSITKIINELLNTDYAQSAHSPFSLFWHQHRVAQHPPRHAQLPEDYQGGNSLAINLDWADLADKERKSAGASHYPA